MKNMRFILLLTICYSSKRGRALKSICKSHETDTIFSIPSSFNPLYYSKRFANEIITAIDCNSYWSGQNLSWTKYEIRLSLVYLDTIRLQSYSKEVISLFASIYWTLTYYRTVTGLITEYRTSSDYTVITSNWSTYNVCPLHYRIKCFILVK